MDDYIYNSLNYKIFKTDKNNMIYIEYLMMFYVLHYKTLFYKICNCDTMFVKYLKNDFTNSISFNKII